jgi:Co/Zn/Cd efflux system component
VTGAVLSLRRTVLVVALLNLAYGAVEVTVGAAIGSVALLADSVDFAEDAAINLLVFFAVLWSPRARRAAGGALAILVLLPAIAAATAVVLKVLDPVAPAPEPLGLAAAGALAVNLLCAALLVRHRRTPGGLARGAWLAARNDALGNVAILAAAGLTVVTASVWPDVVVGAALVVLNAGAAWEVWEAARKERLEAESPEA